ncbi:MAG: aminoacyl-tRNA hydrolase [Candidatus Hodarchaeales archaeon]|jgi:peptidyl-tRNA hydrolase
MNLSLKQVIVLRKDIKLSTEVLIRLVAHSSVIGAEKTQDLKPDRLHSWLKFGQKKITARIENLEKLENLKRECDRRSIFNQLVSLPEDLKSSDQPIDNPVILVIGPDTEKKIDPLTRGLKLF